MTTENMIMGRRISPDTGVASAGGATAGRGEFDREGEPPDVTKGFLSVRRIVASVLEAVSGSSKVVVDIGEDTRVDRVSGTYALGEENDFEEALACIDSSFLEFLGVSDEDTWRTFWSFESPSDFIRMGGSFDSPSMHSLRRRSWRTMVFSSPTTILCAATRTAAFSLGLRHIKSNWLSSYRE